MKTTKCQIKNCKNSGTLIKFENGQICLCGKCRLLLFKALLAQNIPKPIGSKFKI